MNNFDKFYNFLTSEKAYKWFINNTPKKTIRVNTCFVERFDTNPCLIFNNEINEYFLILKAKKYNRKAKKYMKLSKTKIINEINNAIGIKPKIIFKVTSFKQLIKKESNCAYENRT